MEMANKNKTLSGHFIFHFELLKGQVRDTKKMREKVCKTFPSPKILLKQLQQWQGLFLSTQLGGVASIFFKLQYISNPVRLIRFSGFHEICLRPSEPTLLTAGPSQ